MSKAVASAVDYVAVHARLNGARVAAVDLTRARQWTYAEFDDWIARMCAALRRRGIKRGDRVAALAKNRPGLVALHHACARLGVMFVPLNWRLAPPELAWLVRDCAPRILLGDPGLRERFQDAAVRNARRFAWGTLTNQLQQVYQSA